MATLPANAQNLVGQRYGRLIVLSFVEKRSGHSLWECLCDCGARTSALGTNLKRRNTSSCGCLHKETTSRVKKTHGCSGGSRREYTAYQSMIGRCYRSSRRSYRHYGARGIVVCDRWKNGEGALSGFECFLADMGEHPGAGYSIDRMNNDGNYEPSNCRWATAKQQAGNTSRSRWIEHQGERLILADLSRKTGVGHTTILQRLSKGWSIDQAVQPVVR